MSLLPEFRKPFFGWIGYDADCPSGVSLARALKAALKNRGFKLIPLQDRWWFDHFRLAAPFKEMALATNSGAFLGGIDAVLYILRKFWWAIPLSIIGRAPVIYRILRACYRWVAANRDCISGVCTVRSRKFMKVLM